MKSILTTVVLVMALHLSAFSDAPEGTYVPSKIEFLGLTLQLDNYAKSKIQAKVNSLNRSKTHYQVFLDRCNLYFPIIDAILEKEGVPTDFKYLALHESTLKGDAVSKTGATGYWQFKDFTAKELGMKINSKIDERSNVVLSTLGATKYLKKNYSYLGNWLTTLISHNKGLGGTQRSIGKKYNGKRVIKLNRSTPDYVFFCIANKVAFEDAVTNKSSQKLYIHNAKPGEKLSDIAKYTNVNLTTLKLYNHWIKKDLLPNDRNVYKVLIPIEKQNEALIARALSTPNKKGDSPIFASTKKQHKKSNHQAPTNSTVAVQNTYPLVTKRKKVSIGSYSLVMVSANGIPAFIAERGQSPAKVAEFLDMSPRKLMRLNDLKLFDTLEPGKAYYIKSKKSKAAIKTHIVQQGEKVWDVAHKYGITVDALRDKNRLSKKEEVKVGRVLLLRKKLGKNNKPTYKTITPPKKKPTVTVQDEIFVTKQEKPSKKDSKPKKDKINTKKESKKVIVKNDTPPPSKNVNRFPNNAQVYVLKQNETVMTVIQKYGLSIRQFKVWNPMDDYSGVPVGTKLMVGYGNETYSNVQKKEEPQRRVIDKQVVEMKVEAPSSVYHTVQKGDTLYSISRRYQVSIQQIQKNNKKGNTSLSIGEKLFIQEK